MIEKRFRITYDNKGSGRNKFIVHISTGYNIHFRQSKQGMYYYNFTEDTSCRVTVIINAASTRMLPATAPLQKLVLVHTVEEQKELFTLCGINASIAARDPQ